jgi:hypothetical protein
LIGLTNAAVFVKMTRRVKADNFFCKYNKNSFCYFLNPEKREKRPT